MARAASVPRAAITEYEKVYPDDGPIVGKLQQAELDYVLHSESAARSIAENYVGLPLDFGE